MAAMLGWFSEARTSASRWNRARRSGSVANGLGQDLQRDLAVKLRVGGPIDLAHPALADEGGHVVASYALKSHLIRPETDPLRVQFLRSGRGGSRRSRA